MGTKVSVELLHSQFGFPFGFLRWDWKYALNVSNLQKSPILFFIAYLITKLPTHIYERWTYSFEYHKVVEFPTNILKGILLSFILLYLTCQFKTIQDWFPFVNWVNDSYKVIRPNFCRLAYSQLRKKKSFESLSS